MNRMDWMNGFRLGQVSWSIAYSLLSCKTIESDDTHLMIILLLVGLISLSFVYTSAESVY